MYQLLTFVGLLSAAIIAGLMATLLVVMRPLWRNQSDDAAALGLRDFLRYAYPNRIITVLAALPPACTVVIAFLGAPTTGTYALALTGGGVFLVGFDALTVLFNVPIYQTVFRWELESGKDPGSAEGLASTTPDVRPVLRRFHCSNAVRLVSALATGALFFLAA